MGHGKYLLCNGEFCRLSSAGQPRLYSPKTSDLWVFPGPACAVLEHQVKVLPWVRQLWGDAHHEQLCPGWKTARVSLQDEFPLFQHRNQHRALSHCPLLWAHTAPGLVLLGGRTGGARAGSALLQLCQESSCWAPLALGLCPTGYAAAAAGFGKHGQKFPGLAFV